MLIKQKMYNNKIVIYAWCGYVTLFSIFLYYKFSTVSIISNSHTHTHALTRMQPSPQGPPAEVRHHHTVTASPMASLKRDTQDEEKGHACTFLNSWQYQILTEDFILITKILVQHDITELQISSNCT